MGYKKFTNIFCDEEDCNKSVTVKKDDVMAARKKAASKGWVSGRKKGRTSILEFCPKHKKQLPSGRG